VPPPPTPPCPPPLPRRENETRRSEKEKGELKQNNERKKEKHKKDVKDNINEQLLAADNLSFSTGKSGGNHWLQVEKKCGRSKIRDRRSKIRDRTICLAYIRTQPFPLEELRGEDNLAKAAHQRVLDGLEELGLGNAHILGQVPGQVDHGHRGLEPLHRRAYKIGVIMKSLISRYLQAISERVLSGYQTLIAAV
jgi:hypothetical protein